MRPLSPMRCAAWLWLALLLAGCGAPPRAPAPPASPAAAQAHAGRRRAREIFSALPASALAVLVAPDPARLLQRLDLPAPLGPERQWLRYELVRYSGYELSSPAAWTDIGLDPHAPAGVALMAPEHGLTLAVFATVRQHDRTRRALYRWAAGVLTGAVHGRPTAVDDALLVDAGKLAVVLTAERLFIVASEDDAAERARWLLRHPLEGSMASDRRCGAPRTAWPLPPSRGSAFRHRSTAFRSDRSRHLSRNRFVTREVQAPRNATSIALCARQANMAGCSSRRRAAEKTLAGARAAISAVRVAVAARGHGGEVETRAMHRIWRLALRQAGVIVGRLPLAAIGRRRISVGAGIERGVGWAGPGLGRAAPVSAVAARHSTESGIHTRGVDGADPDAPIIHQ